MSKKNVSTNKKLGLYPVVEFQDEEGQSVVGEQHIDNLNIELDGIEQEALPSSNRDSSLRRGRDKSPV